MNYSVLGKHIKIKLFKFKVKQYGTSENAAVSLKYNADYRQLSQYINQSFIMFQEGLTNIFLVVCHDFHINESRFFLQQKGI